MKMKKIFLVLSAIISVVSCNLEKENEVIHQIDDQGVVIATPYIWKTSLHQGNPASNSFVKFPVVYNDNVVIPTTNGDNIYLSFLNTLDGKILWRWNDVFEESERIYVPWHVQYNNLLTFQSGVRSYCINLDNGLTYWKFRRDQSFDSRINSLGMYYITTASITNSDGYNEFIAFKGDIHTGHITEFLTANFTYEHPDCVRAVCFVTSVPNNKNLLIVTYAENLPDWITQSYFGLYNAESKEWIWDKILIAPPKRYSGLYYAPKIHDNKIYAEIENSIVCHDLTTGKQLWKRDFTNDFTFTGFIIEDGRLIANNEDLFAVCLDTETGNELWRVRTAGTSGKMSYLNGIVYFVGGSVPRLFAIEASTGKIVWRIDAALLGEGYGARFITNAVYVLPAKDSQPAKVIALSGLYAYCFEAYR